MLGWSMVFVLLTMLFLLVQLPASWLIQQLPTLPVPVSFAQTQGTVWQGNSQVQSGLLSAQPAQVHWQWQASELISAKAQWQLQAQVEQAQVNVACALTPSGWSVKGAVTASETQPLPQWAQLLPVGKAPNQRLIDFQQAW
ncbi:MAG: hypothetical protein IE928_03540 [Gammaproteobacteria bacterium]|nr:hypothetical protein [Gammaproteobacteria bacterium]